MAQKWKRFMVKYIEELMKPTAIMAQKQPKFKYANRKGSPKSRPQKETRKRPKIQSCDNQ